jgi:hypothetical protein
LSSITFGWFLSLFTDCLPVEVSNSEPIVECGADQQTLFRVWDVFFVEGHDVGQTARLLSLRPDIVPSSYRYLEDERKRNHRLRKRFGPVYVDVGYDGQALVSRQAYCCKCQALRISQQDAD